MRVDEAGHDHRVLVVRPGPPGPDLDDRAVLDSDAATRDRRPVDGQHLIGRQLLHSAAAAGLARSAAEEPGHGEQIR